MECKYFHFFIKLCKDSCFKKINLPQFFEFVDLLSIDLENITIFNIKRRPHREYCSKKVEKRIVQTSLHGSLCTTIIPFSITKSPIFYCDGTHSQSSWLIDRHKLGTKLWLHMYDLMISYFNKQHEA